MKVIHTDDVAAAAIEGHGARGCQMRTLIGPQDNAPTFAMRQFEVAPGGFTPDHAHAHEHEVFVLAGEGVVMQDDRPHPLRAGSVVFVPPHQRHQFRNTSSGPLKFLCLIPNLGPHAAHGSAATQASAGVSSAESAAGGCCGGGQAGGCTG